MTFSFQGSKHMTCGEGGMVITNDAELAAQILQEIKDLPAIHQPDDSLSYRVGESAYNV